MLIKLNILFFKPILSDIYPYRGCIHNAKIAFTEKIIPVSAPLKFISCPSHMENNE
jgi:hypothetical protein